MSVQNPNDRFTPSPLDLLALIAINYCIPDALVVAGIIGFWLLFFRLLRIQRFSPFKFSESTGLTKALQALYPEEAEEKEPSPVNRRTFLLFRQTDDEGLALINTHPETKTTRFQFQLRRLVSAEPLHHATAQEDRLAAWHPFLHTWHPYSVNDQRVTLTLFDSLERRPPLFQRNLRHHR